MSHRTARLNVYGRQLLVERVVSGRPVAHVARELGISRQCAHRWIHRFKQHGPTGLHDRSSRPHTSPSRTPNNVVQALLADRDNQRLGPVELGLRHRVSPSTASRIIARTGRPSLWELDPITGIRIRSSRHTPHRYERAHPGDLIHIDVKKLGRIPDGGGWRAIHPTTLNHNHTRNRRVKRGFDYIHVAIDDHSRLAFAQVLPDEKGATCAAFLTAANTFFTTHGITIREVMTDNALNYRLSTHFQTVLTDLGIKHRRTQPYSPWQNGKAERFNRTMQERWAYRRPYNTNQARTNALGDWLNEYNYTRPHTACGGQPPISRVSPRS